MLRDRVADIVEILLRFSTYPAIPEFVNVMIGPDEEWKKVEESAFRVRVRVRFCKD